MSADHQSRILGMGLLLGRLSLRGLDAAVRETGAEGTLRPEALLAALERCGELDAATLIFLERQVHDLEQFLVGPQARPPNHGTVEVLVASTGELPAAEPGAGDAAGDGERTPQRALWGGDDAVAQSREAMALLSSLVLPSWNQYRNLQFIGEGGMGRIFKAFDPVLNRVVALKFLRRAGLASVHDLVAEARHQAQVDHPNICKVYEVREWNGQVYVAMQFIQGQTLDRIAPELSLNQKVALLETVASAMHAAHRLGLVHRDLKPGNLMVERSADRGLTPYVLDFGLARDLGQFGHSVQGSIVGTYHYMAPEQARGDSEAIDRRTDVYALGVTLYELLCGAPPFHHLVGADCLRSIVEEEIPPIGLVCPTLPPDLGTIVMKCLEKDRERRYGSARALAEDLRRFLDGEPILARPATLVYRLGKRARKHRTVFLLGAVASVVILFLAGYGLRARLSATRQTYWAQHFGQEAERLEALLRYARLQPPHDIRGELATVRLRMREIEQQVAREGREAQGPGHYALGRAHLALSDLEAATDHLQRAWSAGFRPRDAAYTLGRAYGQRYTRALAKVRQITDPGLRQSRLEAIERAWRAPAVELLVQGRGSLLEPVSFQEGLLAFFERRHDDALRLAGEAQRAAPWFYEAGALRAAVHLERARATAEPATARAHLARADAELARAVRTAPSDPDLGDLESRRWWEGLVLGRRAGIPVSAEEDRFFRACDRWAAIVPDAVGPLARRAWGRLEQARAAGAGIGFLDQAIATAQEALRVDPDHEEALGALAAALQQRAYADLDAGRDPRPDLDRAISLLRRALAGGDSALDLFEPFANSHWARIEYEKARGIDPAGTVRNALDVLSGLHGREAGLPDIDGFLGGILGEWADYQASHGQDPAGTVARALGYLERARRNAPGRFEFHFAAGNARLAAAQYLQGEGRDPEAELDAAGQAYRAALACNAANTGPRYGLGEVELLRAQWNLQQGASPLPALQRAEEQVGDARVAAEGNWRAELFRAQAALLRARWAGAGPLAAALLAAADRDVGRALTRCNRLPAALFVAAQIQSALAEHAPHAAAPRRRAAEALLREALAKDPAFAPARKLVAGRSAAPPAAQGSGYSVPG